MKNERILFSRQMLTVMVEHVRLATATLARFNLSYNEFVLLFALRGIAEPLDPESLSRLLLLQQKTVLTMLRGLEDRELITRNRNLRDMRESFFLLTKSGMRQAIEAYNAVEAVLVKVFLGTVNSAVFQEPKQAMGDNVAALRGAEASIPYALSKNAVLFDVDHFLFWRYFVEKSTEITQAAGNMTLTDYRVLSSLCELDQASSGAITELLGISKSNTSTAKEKLASQGLIIELPDENDGRKNVLRPTLQGQQLVGHIFQQLYEMTQRGHAAISDDAIVLLNEYYLHMYSNYRKWNNRAVL